MNIYAVIDTNVIISSMLTNNPYSPTKVVINKIWENQIFYETYLMREDSYLVTGNLRHFPTEYRILAPSDIVNIIKLSENENNILSEPQAVYTSSTKSDLLQRAWDAIERMRESAVANGISDMSMEEIDEEIKAARLCKRSKI